MRRRTGVRVATAAALSTVLAAGTVLAADGGSQAQLPSAGRSSAGHVAGRHTATVTLPASVDYVALGDSYSAGPLIPQSRPDPVNCVRSTNNYPAFLAGYLGVTTYRDVSCSGARVRDLTHPQKSIIPGIANPPAQVDALSADTDLVTVGIGGNDYGLFGSMTSTCAKVAHRDPTGHPCRTHFTNKHGVNRKYRDARAIQRHVAQGLVAVHRAAPDATVVVVGYPRLLPTSGTCKAIPFASGDYAFGARVEALLNRSLRRAAARHHAVFVSTYAKGHDACAGKKAWINGSDTVPLVAAAYHPFLVGERAMARAVFAKLTGSAAPYGKQADPPAGSVVCNPPVQAPLCYSRTSTRR